MQPPSLITFLIILITFVSIGHSHSVRQIDATSKDLITAYVNQAKTVPIPFRKCFKAEPELDANWPLLEFRPTRIGLSSLKSFSIKNQGSHISVLEELRSPNSFKHKNVLVFEGYLMVFFAPNVILIVEETREGFQLRNKYFLENLDRHDQFHLYKLETRALLVVYNRNRAYLLNQIDYEDYTLPEPSSILHLQQTGSNMEFYAAESLKGLAHYRLNPQTKKIELLKLFTAESLKLKDFSYIVDVNLRLLSSGIIYALDAEAGLVEINTKQNKAKLIVSHRNCESFDTISEQHFVLLCQSQGHSTIIEAYRYQDRKTKQYKYRKIQPLFQANYLNDLHLTEQFYIVYSYKSLNVFWNTQKNRLPESLETQSELVIPGLETFSLHSTGGENFLYTVEAGELNKYELKEEKPVLAFRSEKPIEKSLKVYLYGNCGDLEGNQQKVQACRVAKDIVLRVTEQEYPHKQDVNISASIVVILLVAFLLVIWICLKKYKGLQKEARRILDNYKKKKTSQRRAI